MIEFPNLQNKPPVSRAGAGRPAAPDRNDAAQPGAAPAVDVVQISADAALKGKLSAFAAVLAKEIDAVAPERIARLKEAYAGDGCPVSGRALAGAILARVRTEGFGHV